MVPDCLTLAPRDRCMARGPAWIINPFNGKRIFGSGGGVGNAEMNPGGGEWTDYGSVGSSENAVVGKIKDGQVLTMELNMALARDRKDWCSSPSQKSTMTASPSLPPL